MERVQRDNQGENALIQIVALQPLSGVRGEMGVSGISEDHVVPSISIGRKSEVSPVATVVF